MKLPEVTTFAFLSRNSLAAAMLTVMLAACGGSDSSPTTQAADVPASSTTALVGDEQQAKELVQVVTTADDNAVGGQTSLGRVNTDLLLSPSGSNLPATVAVKASIRSAVESAVAKRQTSSIDCAEVFELGAAQSGSFISSCTGSLLFDSNFDEFTEAALPVGAFVNLQYNNMVLNLVDGSTTTLAGSINTTITAPFDLAGTTFAGGMQIAAVGLRGVSENGETFGPESFTIDVTFDADGTVSIISNGVRIDNLDIVTTGSDDTYLISSGSVIQPYGDGYADVSFQNWNVVNGLPQAGSVVIVEGTNGSATITVVSASETSIEFRVDLTVDASPSSHTVIAGVNNGSIVVN